MPIASYIAIISVARAKTYLRIDDTLTDDDTEIESMINAALQYVEKYTNHILTTRDIDVYTGDNCALTVYHYPINSVATTTITTVKWPLKVIYTFSPLEGDPFTYNAGYDLVTDIPQTLIQAALQIIKVWYYESEKQVNEEMIPVSVKQSLDAYRRFI